jgi:hypothetical protein
MNHGKRIMFAGPRIGVQAHGDEWLPLDVDGAAVGDVGERIPGPFLARIAELEAERDALAALTVGKLGIMICDHAEAIVGENWEEFRQAAIDSGYQVIAARAEAGSDLQVVLS